VHGWLEPGSWAEETTLFRKWSKELEVDIVHVALPFHGSRKPKEALFSGEFFWTADLVRSMEGVRQAVCDARNIVGWLREQGYERVGVTGISLGGAITMVLACLSPLPDFIVPIIAHLELESVVEEAPILWRMKRDLENWGVDAQQRRDLFRRLGLSSYRPALGPERQLWIQAREDVYIDAGLAETQWREWGQPNILWIEGGHMTFPLHVDSITRRIEAFLGNLRSA
jgi:pimeloyl-ACP methyl ester carboxylesterase